MPNPTGNNHDDSKKPQDDKKIESPDQEKKKKEEEKEDHKKLGKEFDHFFNFMEHHEHYKPPKKIFTHKLAKDLSDPSEYDQYMSSSKSKPKEKSEEPEKEKQQKMAGVDSRWATGEYRELSPSREGTKWNKSVGKNGSARPCRVDPKIFQKVKEKKPLCLNPTPDNNSQTPKPKDAISITLDEINKELDERIAKRKALRHRKRNIEKDRKRQVREKKIEEDSDSNASLKETVQELEEHAKANQDRIKFLIDEKTRLTDPKKYEECQKKRAERREEEEKKKDEALKVISKLDFKTIKIKKLSRKEWETKCNEKNKWVFEERGDFREFEKNNNQGEDRKASLTCPPIEDSDQMPCRKLRESNSSETIGNRGREPFRRVTPRDMMLEDKQANLYNETIVVTDMSRSRSRSWSSTDEETREKFQKERD